MMTTIRKPVVLIYVDRASHQWVVQDSEETYWTVPPQRWDQRQPFIPTDATKLEPVPGHYKYVLGLP